MSNLEKWIRAILNEDADNLSIGSVRTLQMIKHEFENLINHNKSIIADLNEQRKQLGEKDDEIKRLKEALAKTNTNGHVAE